MVPIVPLKTEHRLIDRMIKLARDETPKIATKDELNPAFIETWGDLLHTYADETHHGKEEDDVFFPASMAYFTDSEQKAMLEEMYEAERQMIHREYQSIVQRLRDQRMGIQS